MYLVSQQESINAERLAEVIEVTYKTAWLMLHKLREAMSEVEESQLLYGQVSIHSHVYGLQMFKPTFDRIRHEHPVMIGSSSNDGEDSLTHLKLQQLTAPDLAGNRPTKYGVAEFRERHIEPSATIIEVVQIYGRLGRAPVIFHYVMDSFRWMNRRFHGIGGKHLQAYLHEYCFRFNRFIHQHSTYNTLVLVCMARRCPTYKDFVARDYRIRYEAHHDGLKAA
ncbi:hypothetical protein ACFO9Q_15665 [Paenibacillus sp. GCM10023252]|uniref:hypothetical protein n=1 Tax=Paenibacillus sp. GCM10023252 TaxID=3252649 RepID=UPI0036124C8E